MGGGTPVVGEEKRPGRENAPGRGRQHPLSTEMTPFPVFRSGIFLCGSRDSPNGLLPSAYLKSSPRSGQIARANATKVVRD